MTNWDYIVLAMGDDYERLRRTFWGWMIVLTIAVALPVCWVWYGLLKHDGANK